MVKVTDLKPGDQVFGWMRCGYALRKARDVHGNVYRFVPQKPERFSASDLSKFVGLVTFNDTSAHTLVIEVQEKARQTQAVGEVLPARIPYISLEVLRRVSKQNFSPKPQNVLRPTIAGIGTGFYPYRTLEEVMLYGY